jgi:hypothetical protein
MAACDSHNHRIGANVAVHRLMRLGPVQVEGDPGVGRINVGEIALDLGSEARPRRDHPPTRLFSLGAAE